MRRLREALVGNVAGGLSSDRGAVDKLISLMDRDDSGTVDLHEFEVFVREQVARGHLIDDCAILLPGGETLTLSHMVTNHTRRNLVQSHPHTPQHACAASIYVHVYFRGGGSSLQHGWVGTYARFFVFRCLLFATAVCRSL